MFRFASEGSAVLVFDRRAMDQATTEILEENGIRRGSWTARTPGDRGRIPRKNSRHPGGVRYNKSFWRIPSIN